VPSAGFELLRPTVTSAVGTLVRTTVNVAVPPASVVVKPLVGVSVKPATGPPPPPPPPLPPPQAVAMSTVRNARRTPLDVFRVMFLPAFIVKM
jgi:hypothetical protein